MKNRSERLNIHVGLFVTICLACVLFCTSSLSETVWSTTPPDDEYITKTQYRYRTKQTTTASSSTLDGWILYDTVYGNWGAWTDWSTTTASASATRSVESKVETTPAVTKTIYKYNHYKYYVASTGLYYYSYGSTWATNNGYPGVWEYLTLDAPLSQSDSFDGQPAYIYNNAYWFNSSTSIQTVTAAFSTTYYRYRDRPVTCSFYRWSAWSAWQDEAVLAAADKEVETRTLYAPSGDSKWSTTKPADPYITMTQYRSRVKNYTTSSTPTLTGWTQYNQTYSAYGSWSAWSTVSVASSNTRNVETKVETTPAVTKTVHKYNHYKYYNSSNGLYYCSYGSTWATNQGYSGEWENISLDYALSQATSFDGQPAYLYQGNYWFNYSTGTEIVTPEITTTYYRYQDRTIIYHFYQWTPWSDWLDTVITATSDRQVETRTLYAVDETRKAHALTIQSNTGGTTNITVASYLPGATVLLTATPAEGYGFSIWSTNNNGSFADASSASTSFTMPANDVTIFATFSPLPTYMLTMQSGVGGQVLVNESEIGCAAFYAGKRISLQAIAEPGYRFSGWSSSNGSSFENENAFNTILTMPANETVIYASFMPIVYELTTQSGTGGQISTAGTTFTYGTKVVVQAIPSDGYYFGGWRSNEVSFEDGSAATTSFLMPNSDVTIQAEFSAIPKTIEFGYTDIPMIAGTGCQMLFTTDADAVVWASSNPDIASVSDCGFVSAHAIGEARITATVPGTDVSVSGNVIIRDWRTMDLPSSLRTIGVEAFQNTPFELIDLTHDEIVTIGDRAFANCAKLRIVLVGSQLASISPTAFTSSGDVVFVCDGECYASRFAGRNGIPYYIIGSEATFITAQSVSLNAESIKMRIGASNSLLATVAPENATNKMLFWTSSNPNVASVKNGHVTATGIGTAIITAACIDGSGQTATCTVEVKAPKVERISVPVTMSLDIGTSTGVFANTLPADAANSTLQWATSDSSVVSITNVNDDGHYGVIYGESVGTAVITVSTLDDSGIFASFEVTVNPIIVSELFLDRTIAHVKVNASTRIEAGILPVEATNRTLTWTSSNPAIASIVDGTLTGVSVGTARITASTNDGSQLSASCDVTVEPDIILVQTLSISKTMATIEYGGTLQLSCFVSPSNATDISTSWSSSNTSVATVTNGGLVTARSAGTAIITVTNGRLSSTCTVTVNPPPEIPPTAIAINAVGSVAAGSSISMTVSYIPNNTTKTGVTWAIADTTYCNIDANSGKLTAAAYVPFDTTVTVKATSVYDTRIASTTAVTLKATPVNLTGGFVVKPYGANDFFLNMAGAAYGYKVLAWRPGDNTAEQTFALIPHGDNTYSVRTENYSGRYLSQSGTNAAGNMSDYWVYVGCASDNTYVIKNFGGDALTRAQTPTTNAQSANYVVSWEPYDPNNSRQRWNLAPVNYTVNLGNATISVGGTTQLSATFTQNGYTQSADFFFGGATGWKSSDTGKVTVDQNGKVTGVSEGSAMITATSACGRTMNCTVTVYLPVEDFESKIRRSINVHNQYADKWLSEANYNYWCPGYVTNGATFGNWGCGAFALGHALEYLCGSTGDDYYFQWMYDHTIYDETKKIYPTYHDRNYAVQLICDNFGVKRITITGDAQSMKDLFNNRGGVQLLHPPGHYVLAVGISADLSKVCIVDSCKQVTLGTNGEKVKHYKQRSDGSFYEEISRNWIDRTVADVYWVDAGIAISWQCPGAYGLYK